MNFDPTLMEEILKFYSFFSNFLFPRFYYFGQNNSLEQILANFKYFQLMQLVQHLVCQMVEYIMTEIE